MIELENRWWSSSVRASVQFPNTLGDSVHTRRFSTSSETKASKTPATEIVIELRES